MYIYGKNVASEYLKENKKIKRAYVNTRFNDDLIIDLLQKNKVETKFIEKNELDRKVDGMHQGIILEVEDFKYSDVETFTKKEDSLILILDHLEDPHNFGAIIRTAEAAGVDGIIIPKDRSVDVNSTVVKVSTGAIENMKIAMVTNIVRTMEDLKKEGFWFVGTDMNGTDYIKIDYKGKTAIIVGNEGAGMSRLVKENCDFIASIPMRGTTNSLNASVATGIVIYEAIKSRI